jgi:radical SAM protein with 4Fe4S-binding SPASM domain
LCHLIDGILGDVAVGHFTLTGGEPLLRSDIFEIIDHVNEQGVPVAIISNAALASPECASKLASRNVHYVQVTLTGPDAETHDRLCGKGSFEATLKGIECLVAAGVNVGGSYLCTHGNCNSAYAVLERMKATGAISHVAFNRFNPSGHAVNSARKLMPTRSDTLAALEQANRFAEENDMYVHCTMPIPSCMVDESEYPQVKFGQCSVGTEVAEYAVTSDGHLKMCTVHGLLLGNVLETPISDLIDSDPVQQFRASIPAFCQECPYGKQCLGGCGAAARWAFGSEMDLDPFIAQHVMVDFDERIEHNRTHQNELASGE